MAVLTVRRGVAELGPKWRAIAGRLPGRSDDAVRNRWKRLAKARPNPNEPAEPGEPNRRPPRAAWSLEEDQTIVEMVARLGFKWGKIEQARRDTRGEPASQPPIQPASQPASQSVSPLTYSLPWIEQVLEGRTPHAIRNRFYRLQQQQQQQQEQELQAHAGSGQVLAP